MDNGDTNSHGGQAFHILAVFLISRRCNLQCTYCNVDAGPHVRTPQLALAQVESWIEALCKLGSVRLSVQLHGGEPLLFNPTVESYAAVIRNAVARHPAAKLIGIGLQTNGLLLDARRLASLTRSRLMVNVSLDGAAAAHDRHRVTGSGKPSHTLARRASRLIQSHGLRDEVIAVISEPQDVMPALSSFLEDGLSGARMNPIRPQGRANLMLPSQERAFMGEMARAYIHAAKAIAAHNQAHPERPFREDNLRALSAFVDPAAAPRANAGWSVLVDETGDLWGHPNGFEKQELLLVREQDQDRLACLRASLGICPASAQDVALAVSKRRRELLKTCSGCPCPDHCRSFAGHATELEARVDPLCTWRREVIAGLRELQALEPMFLPKLNASKAVSVRGAAVDATANPARLLSSLSAGEPAIYTGAGQTQQATHPLVRQILDSVIELDGRYSVEGFIGYLEELSQGWRDGTMSIAVFTQLAAVSTQLRKVQAHELANIVATLAAIGMDPVVAEDPQAREVQCAT